MLKRLLCLLKANVCGSVKGIQYDVYLHLDQENWNWAVAKCSCKADKGGSYIHVAALLYTLVDYSTIGLKEIPCTQFGQRCQIPGDLRCSPYEATELNDISFEKAEKQK